MCGGNEDESEFPEFCTLGDHNPARRCACDAVSKPWPAVPSQDIAFSQLLNEVDQGHVREVTIAGNEITGHFTDNRAFATYAPNDPSLVQSLYKRMCPSRPSRRRKAPIG